MRIRLDPSVSYGNLLQTLVIIGGLVGAWFNMRNEINNHTDQLKNQSAQIRQVQQNDIRIIETQTALKENLQVLTAIVEERTGHGKSIQ